MIINPKIEEIQLKKIIALDTEFSSLIPRESNLLAIPIKSGDTTYVLDTSAYKDVEIIQLFNRIAKECDEVIAHYAQAEQRVLWSNYGIELTNWYCTYLASQNIDKGYGIALGEGNYLTKNMVGGVFKMKKPHSLLGCIRRYLGKSSRSEDYKSELQKSFIGLPKGTKLTEAQLKYAAEDVEDLYDLYLAQQRWIDTRGCRQAVRLDNRFIPVCTKMEARGIKVNIDKHKANIAKWEHEIVELLIKMDKELSDLGVDIPPRYFSDEVNINGIWLKRPKEHMEFFNHGSSKQLAQVFEKLGQVLPRDGKGIAKAGYSFGEDNLNLYKAEHAGSKMINYINMLFDYKMYCKRISTYGEKLLECMDNDGRMRTAYGIATTNTCRLNSSSIVDDVGINMANIPKVSEIRAIFEPEDGYSFIDSDFEGQEAVLAADYSQEPVLMKAFTEGFDFHSFLASKSFSIIFDRPVTIVNEDKVLEIDGHKYNHKKELRQKHKNVLFSKMYLAGPARVYEYMSEFILNHWPADKGMEIATKVSKVVESSLPVLMKYLKSKGDFARNHGYVEMTALGRRRYFDDLEKYIDAEAA